MGITNKERKKKRKERERYVDANGKVRKAKKIGSHLAVVDMSPLAQLNKKQRAFVNALLKMPDPDPERAAKIAGYEKTPGNRLVRHPKICAVYEQLLEEQNRKSKISQEKIVEELAALAFLDPTELFYDDEGNIKLKDLSSLSPMQRKLIDKVSITNSKKNIKGEDVYEHNITVSSITSDVKLKALQLLMKHKGMLIDKRQEEITHKINWEDYYNARNDGHAFEPPEAKKITKQDDDVIDADYEIQEFLDPPKDD